MYEISCWYLVFFTEITCNALRVVSNWTTTSAGHHWNIIPMSCVFVGKTCDVLPVGSNGTFTFTGRHYNATAWLECDPGKRSLYGCTDVWMMCQADGTWNVSMEQLVSAVKPHISSNVANHCWSFSLALYAVLTSPLKGERALLATAYFSKYVQVWLSGVCTCFAM